MKKILLASLLLTSIVQAKDVGDTKEIIAKYIKAWQPTKMELNNGNLVINFNQNRITNDIYMSILKTGICTSVYLDEQKWSNVKTISIVNKTGSQGFVFDGNYETCAEAGTFQGMGGKFFLLGKTRGI